MKGKWQERNNHRKDISRQPIFSLLSDAKISLRLVMSKDRYAISGKSSFFSGIPKKRVFPRNSLHITSRIDEKSIGKKKKNWGGCALVTIASTIVRTIKKQTIGTKSVLSPYRSPIGRKTVPTIRLKQLPAFYGNTAEVTSLADLSPFSLSLLIPLP